MNMKNAMTLFGVLLLGMGLVFAMGGVTVDAQTPWTRWEANVLAGNVTTEGGNITPVNITVNTLTDRWAAFYGNVTGTIVLMENTSVYSVYNWTGWDDTEGGEVCASMGPDIDWSAVVATTGANINTAWTQGSAADNATNTFTDASACGLDFTEADVATSAYVDHNGGSLDDFWTCAIDDNAGAGGQTNIAFCTNISASATNQNYKGEATNYEIMVAAQPGTGTEVYYFYAELG